MTKKKHKQWERALFNHQGPAGVTLVNTSEAEKVFLQGKDRVINEICNPTKNIFTGNTESSPPKKSCIEKKDITFKEFLKTTPSKTLLDYYSRHWDRIMGIHYESEAHAIMGRALFGFNVQFDLCGNPLWDSSNVQPTFKGGLDYLIFPLVARKLYMDVVKDFINYTETKDKKYNRPVLNIMKLLAWGLLEFIRHVIGMLVMAAVLIASPILLCADHDLVTKDFLEGTKKSHVPNMMF